MTSETSDRVFVWVFLPGDSDPTLCGAFDHTVSAGGQAAGYFVYGRSYLSLPWGLAIDPVALPLREQRFELAGGSRQGVFGVIADACPDDWGRYVIDRRFGVQRFPIGYLLHSQEDRVGNLCFSTTAAQPPELGDPAPRAWLQDAWMVVNGLDAGRPIPDSLAERIKANTALGGARPKLTVADPDVQWLAKFPTRHDDPRLCLPLVEAAMLDLARCAGITAAQAVIEHVQASAEVPSADILLVKRFDRSLNASGGWCREAYASARTLFQSDGLDEFSYTGSYSRLAIQISRWSSRPVADRVELFRRMVFNCCISNTDDHDRNHGFIASEDGLGFRLAPAFDMVPRVHGTQRRYQAMNIGDGGAETTVQNILSSADAFGLSQQDARALLEDVQAKVSAHWRQCLMERAVPESAIELLAPCFAALA